MTGNDELLPWLLLGVIWSILGIAVIYAGCVVYYGEGRPWRWSDKR